MLSDSRNAPFLAFAFFLCTLISATLIIQFVGNALNISLVRYALPMMVIPSMWLSYAYFFSHSRANLMVGGILTGALVLLGLWSRTILDLSWDGMAYQQPSILEILEGRNPFYTDSTLVFGNVFLSIAWYVEASLAALHGSIESGKALYIWLLFITIPVLITGLKNIFGHLQLHHYMLAWLLVFSPVVIGQSVTHYIDGMIYLEGLIFIGALFMLGASRRYDLIAFFLMAMSLLFVINSKLSGVYHAAVLCTGAVIYLWIQQKQFPWKMTVFLMLTGLICTAVFGYKPYVSNIREFGSILPFSTDRIVLGLRPPNITPLSNLGRFLYTTFSIAGGNNGEDSVLKWPWMIYEREWNMGGVQDYKNAGFGVFFALGFLLSLAFFCTQLFYSIRRTGNTGMRAGLVMLAGLFIAASILLPEGWWARYAPFAYTAPFLLLLAPHADIPGRTARICKYIIITVFIVNCLIPLRLVLLGHAVAQESFYDVVDFMKSLPPDSIYLVPVEPKTYQTNNHAYIAIQRRLQEQGINAPVRQYAICKHQMVILVNFRVCF